MTTDLHNFPGARSTDAILAFRALGLRDDQLFWPAEPSEEMPSVGLSGAFGITTVRPDRDGTFEFQEDGFRAYIVGAHLPPEFDPVELIAWRPGAPKNYWLYNRCAPILGEYNASRLIYQGQPLKVWETPESWLRHGLEGSVILDWRSAAIQLSGTPRILTETVTLAQGLIQAFKQPMPEVRVMKP